MDCLLNEEYTDIYIYIYDIKYEMFTVYEAGYCNCLFIFTCLVRHPFAYLTYSTSSCLFNSLFCWNTYFFLMEPSVCFI